MPHPISPLAAPEPVADLNRRTLLTGIGAATLAVGSSCRTSDSGEESTPPPIRRVDTAFGEVEVPSTPHRVVCADFFAAFAVVDVGVIPVGVCGGYDGTGVAYEDALSDVTNVGDFAEPDLESVAAQNPDMIVRSIETDEAMYDALAKIAPTVVIRTDDEDLIDKSVALGAAVARGGAVRRLVAGYRRRCNNVRTDRATVLSELTIGQVGPMGDGTVFVPGPTWPDMQIWAAAGARFESAVQSIPDEYLQVSEERLDRYAGSDILLIPAGPDGQSDPGNDALTDSPLWSTLDAVQRDRVFPILTGASSLGNAIDQVRQLNAILAGL